MPAGPAPHPIGRPHPRRRRLWLSAPGVFLLLLWLWPLPAPAQGQPPLAGQPAAETTPAQALSPLYLPVVRTGAAFPPRVVDAIPVAGPRTDRPAAQHADLNLALRGHRPTQAAPTLIDIGGPTDDDAPQLAALFVPRRVPHFAGVHQVYDWNWGCGPNGCQGAPLTAPPVTLIEMAAASGEFLYLPARRAEVYGGGYIALVLYAEETRLTLKYTREDSVVHGYTIHLEEIVVDPALVARYRELDATGRSSLPALRNGDLLGISAGTFKVAVRDTGQFMDPRTRKDWWKGY